MSTFNFINSPRHSNSSYLPSTFTLTAKPKTDIYATPSHGYVFSAPVAYHALHTSTFHRAAVTITLRWTLQFDQGGLILIFPQPSAPIPDAESAAEKSMHPKWVKAGIEVNDRQSFASIVARDEWADWSLAALPAHCTTESGFTAKLRIGLQRHGNALLVFLEDSGRERLLREVQWVFCEERDNTEFFVGVYAARPDAEGTAEGPLEVGFEGLEILEREEDDRIEE
jgi:uncharacterized protein